MAYGTQKNTFENVLNYILIQDPDQLVGVLPLAIACSLLSAFYSFTQILLRISGSL